MSVGEMTRTLGLMPVSYPQRGWSSGERRWCAGRPDRFAVRWAAKEATMKALGCGLDEIDPLDVEVHSVDGVAPRLVLHGAAAERARWLGLHEWQVSLTHEGDLALAFVVGTGEDQS